MITLQFLNDRRPALFRSTALYISLIAGPFAKLEATVRIEA